jgi:hypothetical protein
LLYARGALRAGEREQAAYMPMYLITEGELLSIEEYREKSEAEKQSWLLQVSALRNRAERSEADSKLLNNQLSIVRELNRILEKSFNEYEAESSIAISMKNGEIADLKQVITETVLEAESHKGIARRRLIIIIGLAGAWVIYIVFKLCRFFRIC